jgi:serine/threonine protein kinase/tetratricopeptide (TPR) repeat protein
MMTPERWQQVKEVLARALEYDPAERAAFLDQACANDPPLRDEVERLLAANQKASESFLGDAATHELASVPAPDAPDPRIGQRIGPYKIVEAVGKGGMGSVYRAVRADDQYQKQVAIKLVHAGQDSAYIISRFKHERQILASLDHPNIARLLDGGTTDDGAPYFVMELIEGEPIDQYCNQHRLSIADRLKVFLLVCGAVQFAHKRLIIHRDIKPGNILVEADGTPKLLDFGIAKLLDTEGEDATITLLRALTPGYASPEQIKGAPITTASDVYSLGVVLYELLTGRSPYRVAGGTLHELARAVCESEPERPSTAVRRKLASGGQSALPAISELRDGSAEKLRRGLRGDLDNIVLMALRKEPERRYSSVDHFADDIRRHLDARPVLASKGTVSYRMRKFVQRHKVGVAAAAAVVLALLAGVTATIREARIARQQAAIAQAERAQAQRRFDDVRKLANSLIFEVHDSIVDLPGSTPARKLIMERAVQYLDSLAKDAGGDSSLQRDLAWAYHRIGKVQGAENQGNVGDTAAMLASINKAAALFEQVAKSNPDSSIDQLNAAFAHRLLATTSPREDERRHNLDQAMAITDRLIQADPGNPKVKSERSIELAVLAALQDAKGDGAAAVESFRRAAAMKEDLVAVNYPQAKQGLANVKGQLAFELTVVGSRKEGLDVNAGAISIYESILAQEKNNARAERELGWCFWNRGRIEMLDGNYAGALASFRKALSIVTPLEKQDPENMTLRFDVAGDTASIGEAWAGLGDWTQSLAFLDRAIQSFEEGFKASPTYGFEGVAATYMWRGDVLTRAGRPEPAIADYHKAISILERPGDSPLDPGGLCQLAATYEKLGMALERAGRVQEAEANFAKAIEIATPLKAGSAPNLFLPYVEVDAYFGLGELARRAAERSHDPLLTRAQWEKARQSYLQSQAAWKQVRNSGPTGLYGFFLANPAQLARAAAAAEAAVH